MAFYRSKRAAIPGGFSGLCSAPACCRALDRIGAEAVAPVHFALDGRGQRSRAPAPSIPAWGSSFPPDFPPSPYPGVGCELRMQSGQSASLIVQVMAREERRPGLATLGWITQMDRPITNSLKATAAAADRGIGPARRAGSPLPHPPHSAAARVRPLFFRGGFFAVMPTPGVGGV